MLDSMLPAQNNSLDALKPGFANSDFNLESSSDILPLSRTNSAFSKAEIEIKGLTFGGNFSDNSNLLPPNLSLVSASAGSLNLGNNNSDDVPEKLSVDSLTGKVLSNGAANPIVELAVQSAYGYLKGLANDPDFSNKMNLAFGNNWNGEVASKLVQDFGQGNFTALPGIEILPSAAMNGANGAFASLTNTVYLSQEFIAQNAGNPGAITSVVLEEIGHYIDSKINTLDAAGDEGDIFAATLQGKQLSEGELLALKVEDDTATITLDGKAIQIEMDNTLGSARNIGTLSGTKTFYGLVDTTDTNDFYRFSLSGNSNFSLTLNGLMGDADVELIQDVNNNGKIDSGDVLQGSNNRGTTAEAISGTLNAGTYFARVYPMSGVNTNYNLSLTANPVVSPFIVNITATDASAAETLTGQTPNPGQFTITRTGSTATALTVSYTLGGTATNGSDYSSLTNSVVIPVGATSVTLPINVIDDTQVEANETVVVTLATSSAYSVGIANSSTVTITDNDFSADWFNLNIQDVGLRSAASSGAVDNILDRNDMIAIFRNARDGNVIDATELTDLRTLVSNASRFNMADHVRVLSNKIANSDVANTNSRIGNLSSGSTDTQMDKLIGKWFLGTDRPAARGTYQEVSGSLFQNGVSYQDIQQGEIGDCYFLAGLGTTAFRTPNAIENMFIDNGDKTFTVRFFNNGVADYVTVDRFLPTSGGNLPYAKIGGRYDNPNNELWVALAEKAYAQINQSGWLGRNGTNSYEGIEGGNSYKSMPHITGRIASVGLARTGIDTNAIVNSFNAGELITISSKPSGVASNVVPNHEYAVVGYDSSTQLFKLFNPWGVNGGHYDYGTFQPGILELTSSQITASFSQWTTTKAKG